MFIKYRHSGICKHSQSERFLNVCIKYTCVEFSSVFAEFRFCFIGIIIDILRMFDEHNECRWNSTAANLWTLLSGSNNLKAYSHIIRNY